MVASALGGPGSWFQKGRGFGVVSIRTVPSVQLHPWPPGLGDASLVGLGGNWTDHTQMRVEFSFWQGALTVCNLLPDLLLVLKLSGKGDGSFKTAWCRCLESLLGVTSQLDADTLECVSTRTDALLLAAQFTTLYISSWSGRGSFGKCWMAGVSGSSLTSRFQTRSHWSRRLNHCSDQLTSTKTLPLRSVPRSTRQGSVFCRWMRLEWNFVLCFASGFGINVSNFAQKIELAKFLEAWVTARVQADTKTQVYAVARGHGAP